MKPNADFYRTLQVDPAAEPAVIQAAYRRLAARYHPDVARRGEPDAERMAELNAAYAVLSDPAARARYDAARGTTSHLQAESLALHSPTPLGGVGQSQEIRPMPHRAEISRDNPTLFVFLLDQSGSMSDPFGGRGSRPGAPVSKAAGLADAVNRILSNLVIRCSEGEKTRHYFDVAVLGYGAQRGRVEPALGGALAGREIVSITEIGDSPAEVEERMVLRPDGAGGTIEAAIKFPIWFHPLAGSDTPMVLALERASALVEGWVAGHRRAFPPVVVHLTDGEATDGDPRPAARRLSRIETDDGSVLLFNCHISSTLAAPILFPAQVGGLPDSYARSLFEMSSRLTPTMLDYARGQGYTLDDGARGFVMNADMVDLVRFLDIGTRLR